MNISSAATGKTERVTTEKYALGLWNPLCERLMYPYKLWEIALPTNDLNRTILRTA